MADQKKTAKTSATITPLRKQISCPQCGKPSDRENYPFCSRRCADLDLGSWLKGAYRISERDADKKDA